MGSIHTGKGFMFKLENIQPFTVRYFCIQGTELSKNGKWGPVHVNIPRDVLAGNESFDSFKNEY